MSMLFKCLESFEGFNVGDVIMDCSFCHWCLVKVADAKNKTIYRHDLYKFKDSEWLQVCKSDMVRPLKKCEVIKLLPHMTWRIWHNVGSSVNSVGQQGFSFDVLNEVKIKDSKPRLLPEYMCFDCMKEGNKYMPKKPAIEKVGKCIVCENIKPLHYTQYAYPLDLRSKGFGFSIMMGRSNFLRNIPYMKKHYKIEEWWDLPETIIKQQ